MLPCSSTVTTKIYWLTGLLIPFLFLFDEHLSALLKLSDSSVWRPLCEIITMLGKLDILVIPLTIFLIWGYAKRQNWSSLPYRKRIRLFWGYRLASFICAVMVIAATITGSLKLSIGRARPKFIDSLGGWHFEPFTGSYDFLSMPSGHTTAIAALLLALTIIWPRLNWLAFTAIIATASTRVLLGAHYPSDTMTAIFLAFLVTQFLPHLLARYRFLFKYRDRQVVWRYNRLHNFFSDYRAWKLNDL